MTMATTIWVTRYALSSGIFSVEADIKTSNSDGADGPTTASFKREQDVWNIYVHKPDWYRTREDAVKRANEMRRKKIISLKRQIEKLEALTFEEE
jgi:hypothetical protein